MLDVHKNVKIYSVSVLLLVLCFLGMTTLNVFVQKTTGVREPYSADRVRTSVVRAGVTKRLADEAVREVTKKLRPTMPSETIDQCSLSTLKKRQPHLAPAMR